MELIKIQIFLKLIKKIGSNLRKQIIKLERTNENILKIAKKFIIF